MSSKKGSPRIEAVQHQVRFRLDKLKQRPFEELAGLPAWSGEEVKFGDFVANLTTYRDNEPDGRLCIVVQFMPKGMGENFIWRGVYAEGFWITPGGEITVLPDRFRYAYM
jgi:hypothetical protein